MSAKINGFFLVRVSCATFNHEPFITDAMNGFAMQQTSFPFVCTIIDDASTDGTQDIIKNYLRDFFDLQDTMVSYEKETEYGQVIFSRHKTNKNCHFAVILLYENHYSQKKSKSPYIVDWGNTKYFAICEGDDYWTDPMKLQKQVDYMESHLDCTLCFHNAMVQREGVSREEALFAELEERDYSGDELSRKWISPTASFVIRSSLINGYNAMRSKYGPFVFGDRPWSLWCAHMGTVHAFPEVMSVYRRHSGGYTYNFNAAKIYGEARTWERMRYAFDGDFFESLTKNMMVDYILASIRGCSEKDFSTVVKALYRGILRHPIMGIKALAKIPQERRARKSNESCHV